MSRGFYPRPSLIERFAAKYIEADDGCWLWTASLDTSGYGSFGVDRRMTPAHRFSYELHVGPIPEGHELHHVCEVKRCVNPAHLMVVTRLEHEAAHHRFVCSHGHERRRLPGGRWYCPECQSIRSRRYRARRRGVVV